MTPQIDPEPEASITPNLERWKRIYSLPVSLLGKKARSYISSVNPLKPILVEY